MLAARSLSLPLSLFFGCLVTGHSSDVDLDFWADEEGAGPGGQLAVERARWDLPTVLTFGLDWGSKLAPIQNIFRQILYREMDRSLPYKNPFTSNVLD